MDRPRNAAPRPVAAPVAALGVALLVAVAAGGAGGCMGAGRSKALGVRDGRLGPLPSSPNAVSSQAEDPSRRVEPLHFAGDPAEAMARARRAVESMPRTEIVRADERYLHATFTSRLFRFVDDVELLLDPQAGVIHVRSASRVGYSDLGANRRRVEALREAFER